ncbi:CaiB/BaiF CoA transferase family protein [Rhodococcus wratislaviensis]|uniref:Putative CoA-transferase n=1 Tax=Rhodococcus wratislaviensis NBRC 100605 TaxID=1219028 RepID=X0PW81_RHOWR|nr:CoA transferase [Rhodococcus wratislaviensis]GAF47599.1 putative CoA-transferase [Rhodococcus wratislaviensis NBRC 100605]
MSAATPVNSRRAPLAGVRVVDMTIWMAGSIAGMLLADLGADVVKIESASGDPTRGHVAPTAGRAAEGADAGTSLSYSACNRNKRSMALDLKDPDDREVLSGLLAKADVFVTNLSGPTLRKFGVDEAALRDRYPNLVYARAAGLGVRGPRSDDLAQDMTGMAYAGMLFTMSPDPEEPFAPPGAMNDVLTGTMVAFGILAALAQRSQTGAGTSVSGSLLQTSLWSQMLLVGSAANTAGASTSGRPRRDPRNAALNQYRAGDGKWIAIAAINARAWPVFLAATELEHLEKDPRFGSYGLAVENASALRPILDQHFGTRPASQWLDRLRASGVWCGPVNTIEDVLTDDHVRSEGYLATLTDGATTVSMPFTLHDYAIPLIAGPALDADRGSILDDWKIGVAPSADWGDLESGDGANIRRHRPGTEQLP